MNVPDYGAFFKQLDPVEQDTVKDVNDLQGTNYSFFNKIQDTVQQNTINPKFGQVSAGEGGGGVSKEAEKPKNSSDGMYSKKELEDWAKKVEKGETTLQQFGDFIKAPYEADPKNYIIDEEGTKVFKESVFNQAKNIYGTTIGMINSQYQQAGKTTFNTTIPFTYVKDEDLYKYEEENKQIRAANELNGGDFQKKIEGFMTQKDEWDAHKEKMSKFYGAQTGIGSTQDAVKTADGERSLLRSWVPIQGQQGPQQALKPLKKTYGELTSEGLRGEKKDPGPTYDVDKLAVKVNGVDLANDGTYTKNISTLKNFNNDGYTGAVNSMSNLIDKRTSPLNGRQGTQQAEDEAAEFWGTTKGSSINETGQKILAKTTALAANNDGSGLLKKFITSDGRINGQEIKKNFVTTKDGDVLFEGKNGQFKFKTDGGMKIKNTPENINTFKTKYYEKYADKNGRLSPDIQKKYTALESKLKNGNMTWGDIRSAGYDYGLNSQRVDAAKSAFAKTVEQKFNSNAKYKSNPYLAQAKTEMTGLAVANLLYEVNK